MPDDQGELLPEGGLHRVYRVGDTVRRPVHPWTPRVHQLLRYLTDAGFAASPAVYGYDEQGREVLTYFDGTVGHPPLPPRLRGEDTVVAIARLLRRYHDLTVPLAARYPTGWQYPAMTPAEVICHGDFAPYNCVFQGAEPVGIIDFDTARPGPRWWDLGYVVYCLTPLSPAEQGCLGRSPEEQLRRVQLFFDSYGPVPPTTPPLLEQVSARLENMIDLIHNHPAFVRQRAERHDDGYQRDLAYLREHADLWADLRF